MSFNFQNKCTYQNCFEVFPDLDELIVHIEHNHIDFTKKMTESSSEDIVAVPFSYILKFTDICRLIKKDEEKTIDSTLEKLIKIEDCNILKLRKEESNFEILKPFVCPSPGCKKRYKNASSCNYHIKNGHKNETNCENNNEKRSRRNKRNYS